MKMWNIPAIILSLWHLMHISFSSPFRWQNLDAGPWVLVNSGFNRTGYSRWVRRPPAPTAPSGEAPSALFSSSGGVLFFSIPPLWLHLHAAGRAAGRPRNAVKCTEWSARTSGAPPAAGRKPASASPTKASERETKTWMDEWVQKTLIVERI